MAGILGENAFAIILGRMPTQKEPCCREMWNVLRDPGFSRKDSLELLCCCGSSSFFLFFFFFQRWTLSLWQGIEGALSMESSNYIHCLTILGAGGKNGLQQLHYLGKKNWSYKLLRKMLLLGVLEKIEQLPIEGKVCEKTPLFLFQWSSNLFRFILPSWKWFELRLSVEWLPHVSLWLGHVVMAWSSQRKTDISSCSGELPLRAGAPQEVSDLWNV